MTISEIVKEYIIKNNFNKLCSSEDDRDNVCQCVVDDLFLCGTLFLNCYVYNSKKKEIERMTIFSIIEDYLIENNFNALSDGDDCNCFDGDLFPCGNLCLDCQAAKVDVIEHENDLIRKTLYYSDSWWL